MVFLHSFEPGGVERVALRLCGAWAAAGRVTVQLVIGRRTGAMAAEVPAIPLHGCPEPVPTAGWETIWMMIVLARHIRRLRPDVLFAAGNSYSIVAVAMKLLLGRRCPPIVLKISNDLERRDLSPAVRWVYRRWLRVQGRMIDRFTGLADPMRDEIVVALQVARDRVAIIDDPALTAADVAALAAAGAIRRQHAGRHYLGVGRLAGQKRFGNLLAAFALIAAPADRLRIIGEGPERRRLERQAAALGIADRVDMPGHGAVAPALAAADMLVLSSDYEALPAVVVEALAAGLPVVATDCAVSMRGLVGRYGTIVPRGDVAALANAMATQRPLTAAQRSAAAVAMQRFTVERAAGLYEQLFITASASPRPENAILAA